MTVQKRIDVRTAPATGSSFAESRKIAVSLPLEPWLAPGASVETRRDRAAEGSPDLERLVPPAERRAAVLPPIVVVRGAPTALTQTEPVARVPETPAAPATSRHDPAVAAIREQIRALYDGKRTTARIAELTGMQRRTVLGHIVALGLAPIKGKRGPADDNPMRRKTLARRSTVKAMVAEGKSGKEIADYLGVAISTIHADCIEMKLRIKRGTGRSKEITAKASAAAAIAKRERALPGKIAKAMAAFEKATERANRELTKLGLGQDERAERLRAAVRGIVV